MANNQYLEAAKQIVAFVGGENNVIRVASCATRLRVVVKDDKKIDVDQIEAIFDAIQAELDKQKNNLMPKNDGKKKRFEL